MKSLTLALAASLAALTAAPALAMNEPQTFVFRVDAAALETESDVRAAYQRLNQEAARYCRALDLSATRDLAVCRIDVVANVVEAVGDERLAATHQAATEERQLAEAG
jgi:UrcA family protein